MTDDLEHRLRRAATRRDPVPDHVTAAARAAPAWRSADEEFEALGCIAYPTGDGRHTYRRTTSRPGEQAWKCRSCGDVFVALDEEVEALWEGE